MKAKILLAVVLMVTGTVLGASPPTYGQESCAKLASPVDNRTPELYVFDFYATRSAHCAALWPVIAKAERRFAGRVKIMHVNVDHAQNKPFAEQVGVEAVPTIIVVNRNGDVLKRVVGSVDGTILGILLETLLPDPSAAHVLADNAEAPALPVVLTRQEAVLDPGS